MSSDFAAHLRRLRSDKRTSLTPRPASELAFIEALPRPPDKLLYDTTVYLDVLRDRFPAGAELQVRAASAWHSTVTEAGLAALCGLLNPAHPGTRDIIRQIAATIDRRPPHRTIAPDRDVWRDAGIMSGILARLQSYGRAERQRVFNDALLFCTGRKFGLTVLTRNVRDFDFLQQLDPSGRVVFYR